MKKIAAISILCFIVTVNLYGYERIVFTGGLSRQNPQGAVELNSNYAYYAGGGWELIKDLYGIIKFTFPQRYTTEVYPTYIDINGLNDTLNFDQFTTLDIMVMGHYILPVFEGSKFNPKVFGGLGLHWLYNSRQKSGESDVTFNGIGPEFGLGGVYRPRDNLIFDFTVSVKFPYYNEYKKQGFEKVAVGVDEQVICFNFGFYYLFNIGGERGSEFEW